MTIILEIIGAAATLLGIAGTVYINRMDRCGFLFWIASNILCIGLHLACGLFSLAILYAVYLGFAIDGYIRWKKKQEILASQIARQALYKDCLCLTDCRNDQNTNVQELERFGATGGI